MRVFLNFCHITQKEASIAGKKCKIVACNGLAKIPNGSLIFSHHTHRAELAKLRDLESLRVRHVKAGDLPGSWVIDPTGYSGWSSMANRPLHVIADEVAQSTAEDFMAKHKEYISTNNISKYRQNDLVPFTGPIGQYVFVALQVIDDAVQQNAYIPMLEMLHLVAERFRNSEYAVLVKRHPKCDSELVSNALDAITMEYPNFHLTTASVHSILPHCAAVFTVNSGVGSEALLYSRPLYVFGGADYELAAHQIRSIEDLIESTSPIHSKLSPDMIAKFYFYYRNIYQSGDEEAIRKKVRAEIANQTDTFWQNQQC